MCITIAHAVNNRRSIQMISRLAAEVYGVAQTCALSELVDVGGGNVDRGTGYI